MINMVFWNNECLQVLDAYLSLGVLETWLVLGLNPKIRNLEILNFYFFWQRYKYRFTMNYQNNLNIKHSNLGQNPENYEPFQNLHLVPKPGHQTHSVNLKMYETLNFWKTGVRPTTKFHQPSHHFWTYFWMSQTIKCKMVKHLNGICIALCSQLL